jgi:hypothetical protein
MEELNQGREEERGRERETYVDRNLQLASQFVSLKSMMERVGAGGKTIGRRKAPLVRAGPAHL